eukprot:TRINITY_DN48589_c0_g1_i1.p1 TRINITY_DN48589_c0_g1~~TRINITY_DN48589_c0_g1_i1.p1  ORF type:complete len:994 (-),score=120.71 TRINITY_DN48589_c0_g1_i1:97-3078(-)
MDGAESKKDGPKASGFASFGPADSTDSSTLGMGATSVRSVSKRKSIGFLGYGILLTLLVVGQTIGGIALWSNLFVEPTATEWLNKNAFDWRMIPIGIAMFILLVLYLFDFFFPPHLEGNFRLWEEDFMVGRSLLSLAVFLLVVGALMTTRTYPYLPALSNVALLPITSLGLFYVLRVESQVITHEALEDTLANRRVRRQIRYLQSIGGEEADTMAFLKGGSVAFTLSYISAFALWLYGKVYNIGKRPDYREIQDHSLFEWTPLVFAISNFVFACFFYLRIAIQSTYSATDSTKDMLKSFSGDSDVRVSFNQLARTMSSKFHLDMSASRTTFDEEDKDLSSSERKLREFETLNRHAQELEKLSRGVKVVGMTFVTVAGFCYIASNFMFISKRVTSLMLGVVGILFISFLLALYITFRRVADVIERWLSHLPMVAAAYAFRNSGWAKAMGVCIFLPLVPIVLCVSAANELVRTCRGHVSNEEKHNSILTRRAHASLMTAMSWDWNRILDKVFLLGALFCLLYIAPVFFNVFCSWLHEVFEHFNFWLILGVLFVLGVFLFLLPPVPGATIYMFGGVILPKSCTVSVFNLSAFTTGVVINILFCWLLKLVACAIQQKLIGGFLGTSVSVRRTVGVHTKTMRCVEKVLQMKGMSIGKVAILCGGPDWPTSVLAGILRIPVLQCTIGTLPIIFFIGPLALAGSFLSLGGTIPPKTYQETEAELAGIQAMEMWNNLSRLMMLASVGISIFLASMIAWALQGALDEHYEELSLPLEENIDLHWQDNVSEVLEAQSGLKWESLPLVSKGMLIGSVVLHTGSLQVIFWMFNTLIGTTTVTTRFADVTWFGTPPDAVFSFNAVILLGIYGFSVLVFRANKMWADCATREARSRALAELEANEGRWKDNWRKTVRMEADIHRRSTADTHAKISRMMSGVDTPKGAKGSVSLLEKPVDTDMVIDNRSDEVSGLPPCKPVAVLLSKEVSQNGGGIVPIHNDLPVTHI